MQKFKQSYQEADNIFLMDLSWFLYRSYYTFSHFSVTQGNREVKTGHIFGVLNSLMTVKEAYPDSLIIFCEDGVPEERLEQDEAYKEGRGDRPNVYVNLEYLRYMTFLASSTYFAFNPKREADDLLYSFSKNLSRDSKTVYIYSGDDDMIQAVSDNILVLRSFTKSDGMDIIDREALKTDKTLLRKFKGCSPEYLPVYRSIIGDKSDNLPGVSRFPRKFAAKIASKCNTPSDIKSLTPAHFGDLTEAKIRRLNQLKNEKYDLIQHNYRMMKLTTDISARIYRHKSIEKGVKSINYFSMNRYLKFLVTQGYLNRREVARYV